MVAKRNGGRLMNEILSAKKGDKLFLLGNEAVVRGALEGGVKVVSTYPGTPSSEIGDTFYEIYEDAKIYFEFSVNEKVALEVAAAGSISGLRSFVFMKHVGLNVASDSFMSLAYTDVRGGLVVLSADDPSMFSSQNEQDNRWYARLGSALLFEPSNPQEMHNFMKVAFETSEMLHLPVLMRTTTRVAHMRGIIETSDLSITDFKYSEFKKDPKSLVPVPANAYASRKKLIEKLDKAKAVVEESPLNKVFDFGNDVLVVTSGVSFNYVMDVVKQNSIKAKVVKLGFSYPFPEKFVLNAMEGFDKVLVVEEVDPIVEKEVYALLGKYELNDKKVFGKLDGTLPLMYEYNPDIGRNAFERVLGRELYKKQPISVNVEPPARPPVFCPGCPHRGAYSGVKRAIKKLGVDAIYPNDIGCYTLAVAPPFNMADYLLSMGSSVGIGHGLSKVTGKRIVSFIGDSTFFHAGIPGLIDAVNHGIKLTLVILDNRTTAMTGAQPNPGNAGEKVMSIEAIVKAIGVDFVETVDPYNLRKVEEVAEKALTVDGVSVIITSRPCVLIVEKGKFYYFVDEDKCTGCRVCIEEIACPAMSFKKNGKVVIDETMCTGCAVCVQTCPERAIVPKRREI